MDNAFRYSDEDDRLTNEMISSEYDEVYWGRSEDRVLRIAEEHLLRRFGAEGLRSMTLLDLGCGTGRLIPRFAPMFGEIVALEPDAARCAEAQALTRDAENVKIYNEYLADYLLRKPDARFDAVLCSHIFQHFSHETMHGILDDIERCAPDGGAVICTTTFTCGDENSYFAEFWENGRRTERRTDLDGFVRAVAEPEVLAVCRFSRAWMEDAFRSHGMSVERFSAYHFAGEHDPDTDERSGAIPEKLLLARDAFYLCRTRRQV